MSCCEICNHSPADTITLHCSGDPWDSTQPYTVSLCKDHQGGLIDAVRDGVEMMKEERKCQQ